MIDVQDLILRPMESEDLDRVMPVECQLYSYPWTEAIFRGCLKPGYEAWVVIHDDRYIGHAVISYAAQESHLLNLSIHKDYQRQGLGLWLLQHLQSQARAANADVMFLEVRATNLVATELYLKAGFGEVGIRSGYYPAARGREDARVMMSPL